MGKPVVHFEIGCRDKEASRAFYSAAFGWGTEPYGPFAYKFDTGSERGIQGFTTALGHEPHQYVKIYIEVDDIGAQVSLIESLGGKVVVPEVSIPGSGSFAWCEDVEGNGFGLWKPAG